MPAPQLPLISPAWLTQSSQAPDLRIIDATWFAPFLNPPETGFQAYQKGHIPGAVHFDIDQITDPDAALAHTLPPTHVFSARVRKLGIGDGHRLIIYDQNNFFAAARVWWMFRVMGVTDIMVLDGGLDAWRDSGALVEDLPPVSTERHFTSRMRADLVKTSDQIRALLGDNQPQIIDARPAARFTGQAPEPREGLPSGHIPGSYNIPGGRLLDNGRMKYPDELASLFSEAGIDLSAPIITSCGSGVAAAVTALALATLGIDFVSVYDGSWTDWASTPDNPIATGPGA